MVYAVKSVLPADMFLTKEDIPLETPVTKAPGP